MFSSKTIVNVVLACLLASTYLMPNTAVADENVEAGSFWHEDWYGSAFLSKSTNEFQFCMVDVVFEPGIFFGFIYDREGFALLLTSKDWDFKTEDPFPVILDLDSRWHQNTIAYPSKSNKENKWRLEIPIEEKSVAFEKFRSGRIFTLRSSKKTIKFQLTGASGALQKLSDCYRTYASPDNKPASQ
jgi:hypothetical protein